MSQGRDMDISVSHWGLSWLAGGLSILSPCVFPLLPLVLGGTLQGHRLGPLAMGVGMVLSFASLGVLLGALGPVTGLNTEHVRMSGAFLLMLLGALLWVPAMNERLTQWMTPLATGANAWSARLQGNTLGMSFLLGTLLGLVWSPCSGPLLASALIMAASEGGALPGAVVLGFFGLGAATPLVGVAYASRQGFQSVREQVIAHAEKAKKIMGIVIFVTGLAVASGLDKRLEEKVLAWLPMAWLQMISSF